ncbi:phage exclusion protein Lit family protein [Bacillus cereus]|uniref:phage exclusion protein Lit family protein n=1 Tax=Bacillus cereus TaxID=1396 RepID=UPI001E542762|nr:phage exclusion protein Lit family protein [Bacillus cereus]
MEKKISAKVRFLDRNMGVEEDWDEHMAEQNPGPSVDTMFKLQEDYGNATNYGLGREKWYSNDFFINSLVLKLLNDAEGKDKKLFEELKKVYIGYMGKPGMTVEAMNMVEESDDYLITMNFDIDLQMQLMCELTSSYLYSLHPTVKNGELLDQYIDMGENLLYLVNKNALIEKIEGERMNGQDKKEGMVPDAKDITHKEHIATDLFEAGMSFIIGHEIGHHILKHTESDAAPERKRLEEFEADNFGLDLVIKGLKRREKNYLFAPLMVILMLALAEAKPDEPSEEHPSLKDRYLNLLSKLSEHDKELAHELQQNFQKLATWIYKGPIFSSQKDYWDTKWWI